MKVQHYTTIPGHQEYPGVDLRLVISPEDGAERFVMRVMEVGPGQQTPFHRHWWEHEVFILEGSAFIEGENGRTPLQAGDVVFVKGNEPHHYVNETDQPLRFICVIPKLEPGTPPPTPVEKGNL